MGFFSDKSESTEVKQSDLPLLHCEPLNADRGQHHSNYRAKVPGGWIVHLSSNGIFVPDPEHKWDGGSVK